MLEEMTSIATRLGERHFCHLSAGGGKQTRARSERFRSPLPEWLVAGAAARERVSLRGGGGGCVYKNSTFLSRSCKYSISSLGGTSILRLSGRCGPAGWSSKWASWCRFTARTRSPHRPDVMPGAFVARVPVHGHRLRLLGRCETCIHARDGVSISSHSGPTPVSAARPRLEA